MHEFIESVVFPAKMTSEFLENSLQLTGEGTKERGGGGGGGGAPQYYILFPV